MRKERGRRLSGFVPDMIIIPGLPRKVLDDLRTFCKGIVNLRPGCRRSFLCRKPHAPATVPWADGNPPGLNRGVSFFEKREREEIVWFCT